MSWPKRPVTVGNESARLRLLRQIAAERRRFSEPAPTEVQVAMVLHALADHTALEHARIYNRLDHLAEQEQEHPWPTTTSIGRWLHAVGDDIEDHVHDQIVS